MQDKPEKKRNEPIADPTFTDSTFTDQHSPTGTFTDRAFTDRAFADRDIYRPGTFTDRDIYRPRCSILSGWSTLGCLMGHLPTETFTDRPITDRAAPCLVTGPILAA